MISLKHKTEFENIIHSKLYQDRLRMLFTTNDEDAILNTSFENFKNELLSNLYMIPLKESLVIYLNSHLEFLVYYYNKVVFFDGLDEHEINKLTKEFKISKKTTFGLIPSIWRNLFYLLKDLFFSYNIDFKEQCRKHNGNNDLEHEFLIDFIYNQRAKIDLIKDEQYLEIEFKEEQDKILMLHELGVIDFLRKDLKGVSNNKLGEILYTITKIKPDTIRKYLEKIQNGAMSTESISSVENTLKKLKIIRNKVK